MSSDTLLALINNILDLATIDAGRMQLNLGPVDIREAMQAAAEGVQDRLVSAGLTLDIRAAADIGNFVADGRRLRQILFNLLANAVSFSPGGATVTLAAERRKDEVVFSVTDSGPGIPPDVLEKVFELVRDTSARLASPRSGTWLVAGAVVRRTARRRCQHRLGGRPGHDGNLQIPDRNGRRAVGGVARGSYHTLTYILQCRMSGYADLSLDPLFARYERDGYRPSRDGRG